MAEKKAAKSAKKAGRKVVKKATSKTASKTVSKTKTKKTTTRQTAKTQAQRKGKDDAPKSGTYKIKVGDLAPHFESSATSGQSLSLASFKGKTLVLYFYPKDNTPGCTLEGQDFKRLQAQFKAHKTEIVGVSQDSLKSHENFKNKCGFPFELLSDESGAVCRAFDVIQMKSMYGREFQGIERSTFVIDRSGVIRAEWRKVKVNGHADEVLAVVKKLG